MNRSYYSIIPAPVRYCKQLTANAKLMYGEITALCNESGYCWAGNKYFVELYGVDISSITNWLNQLKEQGFIRMEIIYKEGTKEVKERRIYMIDPYAKNIGYPIRNISDTPIRNSSEDNSIVINNKEDNNYNDDLKLICEYLNATTDSNYRHTNNAFTKHAVARLKEGYMVEDFIIVIDKMSAEWLGTEMQKYLRPETLFGTKFDGYKNRKAVIKPNDKKVDLNTINYGD